MSHIILFSIFLLISCGHSKIEFQSFPAQAEVSVIADDGQMKKLGQTPIDIETEKIFFNSGAAKLLIAKNGYRNEVIYLSKPALNASVKISTNMQEANTAAEIISNQKLEKLSSKIAQAQKYSFNKNYEKAEDVLLNLIREYPEVSVPYDLIANIYYLSNEAQKALFYYRKASEIAPGNSQRDYLINKLTKRNGD